MKDERDNYLVHKIIASLDNLGGTAKLEDIYKEFRRITGKETPENVKASIRGSLQYYCEGSTNQKRPEYFRKPEGMSKEAAKGIWQLV